MGHPPYSLLATVVSRVTNSCWFVSLSAIFARRCCKPDLHVSCHISLFGVLLQFERRSQRQSWQANAHIQPLASPYASKINVWESGGVSSPNSSMVIRLLCVL